MRYSPAYYNAGQMQTQLLQAVCDGGTSARDRAQCARAWIDLERLRREIRGIPPLAVASIKELEESKLGLKRARAALAAPIELAPVVVDDEPKQRN